MNLFRCFAISFALSFAAACSSGPGTDFKVASPDGTLCEAVGIANNDFFVGVQFHPEFKSRPNNAHPLFREFIRHAIGHMERKA